MSIFSIFIFIFIFILGEGLNNSLTCSGWARTSFLRPQPPRERRVQTRSPSDPPGLFSASFLQSSHSSEGGMVTSCAPGTDCARVGREGSAVAAFGGLWRWRECRRMSPASLPLRGRDSSAGCRPDLPWPPGVEPESPASPSPCQPRWAGGSLSPGLLPSHLLFGGCFISKCSKLCRGGDGLREIPVIR